MRWTARRKAAIVLAIEEGRERLADHGLSPEEFAEWQWLYARYGAAGLRATRLRRYRPVIMPRPTPGRYRPTPRRTSP
jgi:hypothetical protein